MNYLKPTIIDDAVPSELSNDLENIMLDAHFPWYLTPFTSTQSDYDAGIDHKQFTHSFYWNDEVQSQWFEPIALRVAERIPLPGVKLLRAKANLVVPQPDGRKITLSSPHVDDVGHDKDNFFVCIYYVNDSDGETVIFNETKSQSVPTHFTEKESIKPKKGRMVIFDGRYYHSGGVPSTTSERCVINFNFTVDKYHD